MPSLWQCEHFEFSDAATDLTNAFSTSIAQSAFSHMCAELLGAPPPEVSSSVAPERLMRKTRPRASSVGASPSKEGLSTISTWQKAAPKKDSKRVRHDPLLSQADLTGHSGQ